MLMCGAYFNGENMYEMTSHLIHIDVEQAVDLYKSISVTGSTRL